VGTRELNIFLRFHNTVSLDVSVHKMLSYFVSVHGFKGFPLAAGLKGCALITICHFVSVLYRETDRFYVPTNLEHGIWQ
jgi:hypothetical protein